MKGIRLAIILAVMGSFGVIVTLYCYSVFYNNAFYNLAWDWVSFFGICLGLIIVGVALGAGVTLYAYEKAMEEAKNTK